MYIFVFYRYIKGHEIYDSTRLRFSKRNLVKVKHFQIFKTSDTLPINNGIFKRLCIP